jgi:hypothetical protein
MPGSIWNAGLSTCCGDSGYVKVELPKALPSELRTLQKACLARVFEESPEKCGPNSIVGHATAITPILPVPLSGNAYFVSYGGAQFPELILVLKGYGVTIDLHGETYISKAGITSSTFKAVPDQPVTSFELTLPEQPYSALGANLPHEGHDFCGQRSAPNGVKLTMPTHFIAQNGMELSQTTPITVTGCPKGLTRAQKLTGALKACRKKHNRPKRAACERAARRAYGAKASKRKR